MTGQEVETEQLMAVGGDAVAAIIAAGCGYPGDENAETIASKLSIDAQADLLATILRLTLPKGIGPFVEKLTALGGVFDAASLDQFDILVAEGHRAIVIEGGDVAVASPKLECQLARQAQGAQQRAQQFKDLAFSERIVDSAMRRLRWRRVDANNLIGAQVRFGRLGAGCKADHKDREDQQFHQPTFTHFDTGCRPLFRINIYTISQHTVCNEKPRPANKTPKLMVAKIIRQVI
jgi:hypothetical protein